MRINCIILFLCSCSLSAFSAVRLHNLFADEMVIQREQPIQLHGYADKGEAIQVTLNHKTYHTVAKDDGTWCVSLPSQKAGGPHTITVNERSLKNVFFGDVWLCSGQSNMELPIRRVRRIYEKELKNPNNRHIRYVKLPISYAFTSENDTIPPVSWAAASETSIDEFSAVAYFFAVEMEKRLGVPIGLVNTAVGGSPIEAWVPAEVIKRYPHANQEMAKLRTDGYVQEVQHSERLAQQKWDERCAADDEGLRASPKWSSPLFPLPTEWSAMTVPGYWNRQQLSASNGTFWIMRNVTLSAEHAGKEGIIELGCIKDADEVFVNGTKVGATGYQYPPRIYQIPTGVLSAGNNRIVVRAQSHEGEGGFVPDKPYELRIGKEHIDLSGEWLFKQTVMAEARPGTTFFQYKPTGLYNALIAPLKRMNFKGVLWYQGESNCGNSQPYASLFPEMITEWRKTFDCPKLPFLYVQLANFMEPSPTPQESGWAELREIQRRTLSLPHTAMATIIDIGEWNDIHPLRKKEVGERLALGAMRMAYDDEKIVYSGPIVTTHSVKKGRVTILFDQVGKGLYPADTLHEFAIAGADRKFVKAHARIINHNTIEVWSKECVSPQFIRYAWAHNPDKANLFNSDRLPASPFELTIQQP